MHTLAMRPRVRSVASSAYVRWISSASLLARALSSTTRARSMMRASRPATAPIMPATAVSRKTGATAS